MSSTRQKPTIDTILDHKIDTPYKSKWIQFITHSVDPHTEIQIFLNNYYYFSLNQILAFSKIIGLVSCFDPETLSILAETIFDELGRGKEEAVHSVLFRRFMDSISTSIARNFNEESVLPGVRAYIHKLNDCFKNGPLTRALAAYFFLEKSATEIYVPMYYAITAAFPNISKKDKEFFSLHAHLEPQHEQAARELILDRVQSTEEIKLFQKTFFELDKIYKEFWQDIYDASAINNLKAIVPCVE